MSNIVGVVGREILDSRGNPTIEVDVVLDDGAFGRAAVPSGASTGKLEAVELRDGDMNRFGGKGVLTAVEHVNRAIREAIEGRDATDQVGIDQFLIELDGTRNKSGIGANATLGVSLAVAKAAANSVELPLYRYVGGTNAKVLPVPLLNVINGGCHADNSIDVQEFMLMPTGAASFRDAFRIGSEVYHALKRALSKSGYSTSIGDEGGFAPDLRSTTEALDFLLEAVAAVGLNAESDVQLALDCASSEYFEDGIYDFAGEGVKRTIEQNVAYLSSLSDQYPICSIEDGCSEDDWLGWKMLTTEIGGKCQLVGDDLFVTNCDLLKKGIESGCANSLLVKVNQIGTLTEALDAVDMAHRHGYTTVMSHRSGETEDSTIADLAVATNCSQIKSGATSRSDRTAKYNQLLRIEEELETGAVYIGKGTFNRFLVD